MKESSDFYLYKRHTKDGEFTYHAKIKTLNGYRSFSTGTDDEMKATRWAAKKHAEIQLNPEILPIPKRSKTLFRNYAADFFSSSGRWAQDRRATGRRLSQRQCDEKERILNTHVIPAMGDKSLSDIDRRYLKDYRNTLHGKGYAGSTINHILSCIKTILEYAEEEGLISGLPKIERASDRVVKPRGILTPEEMRDLFNAQWDDHRAYVMSMLAAASGLRMGECLALRHADLKDGYICIEKTWDHISRKVINSTKTGRARTIIIPRRVQYELERLITLNPFPGGDGERFIFFGKTLDAPLDGKSILKYFKRALRSIGITEPIRQERVIVWHSFRHFFNSLLLNEKIPVAKVQQLTGHLSDEMTENYYHLDDLHDIRDIQERLFPPIE